ncbi:hypothetical protein J3L16_06830 [Alteromonas sp. 5E99-2]|uniref:hypothetical protein n=1 Tax=Alteromonas sp. 5E99-2 TaxID=2817683 RepID=UPI001A9987DB|nr:hypothetical protein [Alteromonas sp. 5E99-2]MBO1255396.1 hypothetical protein [Alteromonas sp. 5E99-2]
MKNRVEYVFDREPIAYRFLNTVSHWDVPGLTVKFGQSSFHVLIEYTVQKGDFDTTLSQLDDLSAREGGVEAS